MRLRPCGLDYDKLEEAADLITRFKGYWDRCADVDDPREARRQLMSKIIDRVFLYNHSVIAVALYPDFGVVLDVPDAAPDQILSAIASNQNPNAITQNQTLNTILDFEQNCDR